MGSRGRRHVFRKTNSLALAITSTGRPIPRQGFDLAAWSLPKTRSVSGYSRNGIEELLSLRSDVRKSPKFLPNTNPQPLRKTCLAARSHRQASVARWGRGRSHAAEQNERR